MAVGERLYCRHCLAMFLQQVVWTVVDSKIAGDAFALDIGVVAVEVNRRMLEVLDGNAVAAKWAGTFRVGCLQVSQIAFVEDEAFQIVPASVEQDLDPAVQDFLRCIAIDDAGHGALLQLFVDHKAVDPAGDATGGAAVP